MNNMHAHMHAYNFIHSMMYRGSISLIIMLVHYILISAWHCIIAIIHATSTLTCMTL